ncbi:MAG: DNA starvation/stationary phase protection protein [Sporolactobacillus sp.]
MEKYNYDFPKTKTALNQLIADISELSAKVHQAHWYMRGLNFYTMHPKMDEFLEMLDGQLDDVAERLIAIGGAPYASLTEFLAHTVLKDTKTTFEEKNLPERISDLVVDFKTLRDQYQETMDVSGAENDLSTQDMVIEMKTAIDKNIWMMQAFLNKAPLDDSSMKISELTYK